MAKNESSKALSSGEATYSDTVESTALWTMIVAGVIMFIVMWIVNIDRESVPFIPDRGSVGYQALIASMLLSLIVTPYAYLRSNQHRDTHLPEGIRGKYRWSVIPITIAITIFMGLATATVFEIITRAFEGIYLSRISAALRLSTSIGIMAYVLVSWVMRMRISNLIYVAIFYLFATLLTAGAMNENPMWYQNSFSYLGMTASSSKFIFNIGLPFTGVLIVLWSFYFTEYLNILRDEKVINERTRNIIRWAMILTGVLLSLVGIVRFGVGMIFNIIHDLSATGMGVVLGILMLFMYRLIKDFPRVFYIFCYVVVAMLVVAVTLMVMGVYSLTGLEMSAFTLAGFWLLVFYRNVVQVAHRVRPGVEI